MEEGNREEGEEDKTVGEADNSAKESRALKEDKEIRVASVDPIDPVHFTEKSFTYLTNSLLDDSNHLDVADSGVKEEKIVELCLNTSTATPEVAEQWKFPSLNKSEGIILQVSGDSMPESEETKELICMLDKNEIAGSDTANINPRGILEGVKSSPASNEDTGDSSSDSDLDSSYIFHASLPVSEVEEPENFQAEVPEFKSEDQRPLLSPKQRMPQPTSWKNCCGLLELLHSSGP